MEEVHYLNLFETSPVNKFITARLILEERPGRFEQSQCGRWGIFRPTTIRSKSRTGESLGYVFVCVLGGAVGIGR